MRKGKESDLGPFEIIQLDTSCQLDTKERRKLGDRERQGGIEATKTSFFRRGKCSIAGVSEEFF